jgi:hypothetical protein
LGRRHEATNEARPGGIQIQTRCGANWCVDGLSVNGRSLVAPVLTPGEARSLGERTSWRERVLRISWQDESFVSMYFAESEYSGGAHANNILRCRTFDSRNARAITLRDLTGAKAAERLLVDAKATLGELGNDSEFNFTMEGFRLVRSPSSHDGQPAIVLCGEGEYPRNSGVILEARVDLVDDEHARAHRP